MYIMLWERGPKEHPFWKIVLFWRVLYQNSTVLIKIATIGKYNCNTVKLSKLILIELKLYSQ